MFTRVLAYIIFLVIWIGLAGIPSSVQQILFMVSSSLLTLFLSVWLNLLPKKNYFKISFILYASWLLKEILMSSIAVIKISWRRNLRIQPILEPLETIQKNNVGITTYANSITLTPGTVTLSTEDNYLLVHALDISFMNDLQDGEMDKKIKEVIK